MSGTVILGAGLSGLGCARSVPGAKVFEAQSHAGGHAYSHELEGVFFDEGAHICHARDPEWLEQLFANAGEVEHIPQSDVASYWHGRWITYPTQNHLRDLAEEDRIAALSDFVEAQARTSGESPANYREWLEGQYGSFLTERFYSEYTKKYWRVPMEELGTDWLGGRVLPSQIPRIVRGAFVHQPEEQSVFSAFHYPRRGGFYAFFEPFSHGVDITYDARASRIDPRKKRIEFEDGKEVFYEHLASSIPLTELVAMMPGVPSAVAEAAAKLRCTQLLCVNVLVNRPNLVPHHWFYVYDEDIDVSRVKVNTNIAPHSAPEGVTALQCEIFRLRSEELEIPQLVDKTLNVLARLLDFDPARDLRAADHVHVRYAYPLSDLHREAAVETILDWVRSHGIHPMGLYGKWRYLWSDAAFRAGQDTAASILAAP